PMGPSGLSGYTVAVTADRRRDEQVVLLSRLGLKVRQFPLLRTSPANQDLLRSLTRALIERPPDLLLANTGYGMRTWFGLARDWGLLENLVKALAGTTLIGARGAKSLGELRRGGLDGAYRAPSETLDEVVAWA